MIEYVTLGLFEFGKILLYLDLDPEKWPSAATVDKHPIVRMLLEGSDGPDDDGESHIRSTIDDTEEAVFHRDIELELVDRADSSQCEAVHTALKGANLVVEGPPGTGKSQTITNLIAAAMAKNMKVLFVAEKLAALEVVRRRLRELGLGEFCLELHSHKTKKTEAFEDIADRLKLTANKNSITATKAAIGRLIEKRNELKRYIDVIGRPAGSFLELSIADALMQAGHARRILGSHITKIDRAKIDVEAFGGLGWIGFTDCKTRLRRLRDAYVTLGFSGSAFAHPWAGVSSSKIFAHDTEELTDLCEAWARSADTYSQKLTTLGIAGVPSFDVKVSATTIQALYNLETAFSQFEVATGHIEDLFGITFSRSSDGAKMVLAVVAQAARAPINNLKKIPANFFAAELEDQVSAHFQRLGKLRTERKRLLSLFKSSAFEKSPQDLEAWSQALANPSIFRFLSSTWRHARAAWRELINLSESDVPTQQASTKLSTLSTHLHEVRALEQDADTRENLGAEFCRLEFDHENYDKAAGWVQSVRSAISQEAGNALINSSPDITAKIAKLLPQTRACADLFERISYQSHGGTFWESAVHAAAPGPIGQLAIKAKRSEKLESFLENLSVCASAQAEFNLAQDTFVASTELNKEWWMGNAETDTLAAIASRARFATSRPNELTSWLEFDRALKLSKGKPEEELAELAAADHIDIQKIDIIFDYVFFDNVARKAFNDEPSLLSVSGRSLDALRDEYRAIDAEVMELRRSKIAAELLKKRPPDGRSSGLKSDQTEMALIRAETAKQKRHIPLRQLVARAGASLQILKPCFMMGPLSVAQYIAPGSLKFDLVIMDEASQMRPEDAIGALARGGQAIIVGDPKQLPPTSFFDRVAGAADDGDDGGTLVAEESKSILELASGLFDARMLKWHYRSRHESLIAFSNYHFYKNELIVFPSPTGAPGRFGIGWNHVKDGLTTAGVNQVEARTVAEAAAKLIKGRRGQSVGVVAMNVKQAQRISDELANLAAADSLLAEALAAAEDDIRGEPFFVKNLENVQGDERDVIVISMTYGPSTVGGRVAQNFGPINQDTGWRRLNVLFTRAKERMEVFSSMRSLDVIPREGADRGPRALKNFLEYAETGRLGGKLEISDRPTGSEFEDAVLEGLRGLGFACEPQLGVSNFYLDIAVRDPSEPTSYIAAIECDGAAYHSQKSARDRDRLRQEILENLGWTVLRIWSTDWFRNPGGELQRISKKVLELIEARKEQRAKAIEPAEGKSVIAVRTSKSRSPEQMALLQPNGTNGRGGITLDQARAQLIDLRERTIKPKFPDMDASKGLLRKSMLDELLQKRPSDMVEFRNLIRRELREQTSGEQVREYAEEVFDVLSKVSV